MHNISIPAIPGASPRSRAYQISGSEVKREGKEEFHPTTQTRHDEAVLPFFYRSAEPHATHRSGDSSPRSPGKARTFEATRVRKCRTHWRRGTRMPMRTRKTVPLLFPPFPQCRGTHVTFSQLKLGVSIIAGRSTLLVQGTLLLSSQQAPHAPTPPAPLRFSTNATQLRLPQLTMCSAPTTG